MKTYYGNIARRWVLSLLFILFFYFFVVLVVIREKSPEIRGFSRQPARQRDNNRGCNGLSFSEWKLHLFCDLHKTIHRFFRRVAGVRCRVFTLPALLSAIFGKHSWVPFCLPYSENILGFGKYRQLEMHWFIISLYACIIPALVSSGIKSRWCSLRYRCMAGLKASLNLPLR